jgi:hypothetical protein
MTAITRNPSNPNFLQPNKFQLNFSRSPQLQYFCQSVSIPGISMSEVPQNTPFVDVFLPGEKAIYDLLNVTFLVDEELTAWIAMHDWIRAMTFPENFEEYRNLKNLNPNRFAKKPQYSDAKITLLSSANNPIKEFVFYDVFPTTLSTIIMSATDTPDSIITADVTFRYSYYDIKTPA